MPIPKIQSALNGWETNITLIKISQAIDSKGIRQDTETQINFKGVVQPLKVQESKASELGKRAWQSWMIHTRIAQELNTDDKVLYKGKRYTVIAFNDFELNNYFEYHLIRSYE
jgi:hypothetical protein